MILLTCIHTNGLIMDGKDMVDISTHYGLVAFGGGFNYRVPLVSWQISSNEFCHLKDFFE